MASAERKYQEMDYRKCIICQQTREPTVTGPRLKSIEKILNFSQKIKQYGDTSINEFMGRTKGLSAHYIYCSGGSYHRVCYTSFFGKMWLYDKINGRRMEEKQKLEKASEDSKDRDCLLISNTDKQLSCSLSIQNDEAEESDTRKMTKSVVMDTPTDEKEKVIKENVKIKERKKNTNDKENVKLKEYKKITDDKENVKIRECKKITDDKENVKIRECKKITDDQENVKIRECKKITDDQEKVEIMEHKKIKSVKVKKKISLTNITNVSKVKNHNYKESMKVLVRWSDGLKYSAKIEKVDEHSGTCLVRFDDLSSHSVLFKDVIQGPTSKYREIVCSLCHNEESLKPNEIVLCDICGIGYHQNCHKPEIGAESLVFDAKWECRSCIFARCTKKGGALNTGEDAEAMRQLKKVFPYKLESLQWDKQKRTNKEQCYCYCGGPGLWFMKMIQCIKCNQWFHEACVQCLKYPLIYGDRLYIFICSCCNSGHEYIRRIHLCWVQIAQLALFNLTFASQRKYFDLHDDIEMWINSNWEHLQLIDLKDTPLLERTEFLTTALQDTGHFKCGREIKKAVGLFGLRYRIPPSAPKLTIFDNATPNDDIKVLDIMTNITDFEDTLESPVRMSLKRKANNDEEIQMSVLKRLSVQSPTRLSVQSPTSLNVQSTISCNGESPTIEMKEPAPVKVSRKISDSFKTKKLPSKLGKKRKLLEMEKENCTSSSPDTVTKNPKKKRKLLKNEKEIPCSSSSSPKVMHVKEKKIKSVKNKRTLDSIIPWPCNYEGLNHPFKTIEEYNKEKAYNLEKKDFIDSYHSAYSSCGDTDSELISDIENSAVLSNNSKSCRLTRRNSNIFANINSMKTVPVENSIKDELVDSNDNQEIKGVLKSQELPLRHLKNSFTNYFGAADRLVHGEKFNVLARRIKTDGDIQYLVQWNGIS